MCLKLLAALAVIGSVALPRVLAVTCIGCVDLDELSFDQVVERFPYVLVKFDIAFPYDAKHEAFAAFAKAAHKVTKELLVAAVGIKDYGENENKELGKRFGVELSNVPAIILFKGGRVDNYVRFPDHLDVTLDNLKSFVTQNSELYIGRDGCLKEFNVFAAKYANKESAEQLQLLQQAEEKLETLTAPAEQASAKVYLLFMRKINEQGYDFVETETKRLLRLKAGKVAKDKKTELQQKLNILDMFRVTKLTKAPQEPKEDL